MDSPGSAVTRSISLALLAAAGLSWFVFCYGYVEDDAFIHLEFARNVAAGHGFSFNGHLVNGDTSPLWVLILVGLHLLGIGWIAAAKLAASAGILIALGGAWRLACELAAGNPRQSTLPVASVFVTALNPFFAHWVFSGMEAVTALGLSLWAISLGLAGRLDFARCLGAAALLALAPLLRPEFLLFDAIMGPLLLWRFSSLYTSQPLSRRLLATSRMRCRSLLALERKPGLA